LSLAAYPIVYAVYKGYPRLSANALVAATQLSNNHIARNQRNSTLNATFSGTLSGHVNHKIPDQAAAYGRICHDAALWWPATIFTLSFVQREELTPP
jgi:hypothetical protein